MTLKYARHSKILEIIKTKEIETQDELAIELRNAGFNVTQATVSRDIKEMRLTKVLGSKGNYKYVTIQDEGGQITERFLKLFKNSVTSLEGSGQIIVIKTLVGSASAAAVAVDAFNMPSIMGCIAGDDTIFLVIREQYSLQDVLDEFNQLLNA